MTLIIRAGLYGWAKVAYTGTRMLKNPNIDKQPTHFRDLNPNAVGTARTERTHRWKPEGQKKYLVGGRQVHHSPLKCDRLQIYTRSP